MNDINIANNNKRKNILELVKDLNIDESLVELYGKDIAKIDFEKIKLNEKGKLILVTAINPTPYGEGKTTMSIGLLDGLNKMSKKAIACLREPSQGPVFGFKGGACGGGYSQMVPMDKINLHFTGDIHAISSANNLIAAAIDNHIYQGNELRIDKERIVFKRCLDVNDRSLRKDFNITAASEVMSVFSLAESKTDLKERLANILLAFDKENKAVYLKDLKLESALTVILKDAIKPNLVQSLEHNPVLVHGGPFANIAHGCSSIIATKMALKIADYVVTEAGFGADLGAEKFFNIKCRKAKLNPDCVVLVATSKALKYNSMMEEIEGENVDAINKGIVNLGVHIDNLRKFTEKIVVCLNKYADDSDEEIAIIKDYCAKKNVEFAISESHAKGGEGSLELAEAVLKLCEKEPDFKYLYEDRKSVREKIDTIAKEIYHASSVEYSGEAEAMLEEIARLKLGHLPVCISKTQYSLSDNPALLGAPQDFKIKVRAIEIYNGAGFITVILGKTIRMPGLPKKPNYEIIELDSNGNVAGLM